MREKKALPLLMSLEQQLLRRRLALPPRSRRSPWKFHAIHYSPLAAARVRSDEDEERPRWRSWEEELAATSTEASTTLAGASVIEGAFSVTSLFSLRDLALEFSCLQRKQELGVSERSTRAKAKRRKNERRRVSE